MKIEFKVGQKPEGIEDLLRSKAKWFEVWQAVKALKPTQSIQIPEKLVKINGLKSALATRGRKEGIKCGIVLKAGIYYIFKRS